MSYTPRNIRTCVLRLAATLALVAVPHVARAQTTASQLVPDDVRSFAADYVAAINAKDSAKLWSFLTPETRSCVDPSTKDVYDALFNMQFEDTIPSNYLLKLSPISEAKIQAFAESQFFPLPPEHELQIDYQIGDDAGALILWIVHQNGRVYADQPCATEEFIVRYRDQAAARAHYKQLAADIQDPLRSELLALIANHKRAAAISRYKSATSSDMRTSMLVINSLKQSAPSSSSAPPSAPTAQ